eukprot:2742309-Prymnesium_polylepis.1
MLPIRRAASRGLAPFRRALSTPAVEAAKEINDAGKAAGLKFYRAPPRQLGPTPDQFSFIDLFGVQRSKLVPASRVEEIATDGAGFAGFAAHLDLEPTDGDLLAMPDPKSLTPLPWKPEVGWLACDLVLNDEELAHGPRNVLRSVQARTSAPKKSAQSGDGAPRAWNPQPRSAQPETGTGALDRSLEANPDTKRATVFAATVTVNRHPNLSPATLPPATLPPSSSKPLQPSILTRHRLSPTPCRAAGDAQERVRPDAQVGRRVRAAALNMAGTT